MKKIKTTTGIIIIVTVAVLLGGGALTYFYYAEPKEDNNLETYYIPKTQTPISIESDYDTSSWKIFVNKKYGYEIKLPADWKAYSEYDGSVLADSPDKFPENNLILTGDLPAEFQMEIIENFQLADYKRVFLSYRQDIQYIGQISIQSNLSIDKFQTTNGEVFYLARAKNNILKVFSKKDTDKVTAIIFSLTISN